MASPVQADQTHGQFGQFGKLMLAIVESLDFLTDETGQFILDENENPIPTGSLNIRFLEREGGRRKVPYVLPWVGNTVFCGGIPEEQSLCVVGFRERGQPIVIGFVPQAIHNLVANRKTIKNMEEGEFLIQSSIPDVDVDGIDNKFRGARVKWDKYGRLIVAGKDFEVVYGYVLSDEYTSLVSAVNDPVTNQKVFFREKLAGYQRTVDVKGSISERIPADRNATVGGNHTENITGNWTKTIRGTTTIQDSAGNKIFIDEEGVIGISAGAGSIKEDAQGNKVVEIGGHHDESIMGRKEVAVGEASVLSVSGETNETYGGDIEKTQTAGSWEETSVVGKRTIEAATGITLSTTIPLAPIKVGSDNSSEELVLGKILVQALNELVRIISATPPGIGIGNLGAPVPINPAIPPLLIAWAAKYMTASPTNILSLKAFTEKGP